MAFLAFGTVTRVWATAAEPSGMVFNFAANAAEPSGTVFNFAASAAEPSGTVFNFIGNAYDNALASTYNLRLMTQQRRHFDRSARGIPRLRSGQAARSGEISSPMQGVWEGLRGIAGDSSTSLRSARNDGGS
ncbi:MAG: hypothetical protein LBG31_00750 [Prevotellaceae bacterium]|jgi:hypothetical protein|nr:hypothetical protein [Prevotellaceae bacterium]